MTNREDNANAIKAMADTLFGLGYTRDNKPTDVQPPDAISAAAAMLEQLRDDHAFSLAFEFISEGSVFSDSRMIHALIRYMDAPREGSARALSDELTSRARVYGESFIAEALELLPTRDEIERGRKVDHDIKKRKESA